MAERVFVSYAREDVEVARFVAEALRAVGFRAWLDVDGQRLLARRGLGLGLATALRESALVVAIIGASTHLRPWVRAELHFARTLGMAVVALRLPRAALLPSVMGVRVVESSGRAWAVVANHLVRAVKRASRRVHPSPAPDFSRPRGSAPAAGRVRQRP